ncbi:PREDICTED: uncharacterized protein LOC107170101 isoform X2 [Diuraphis noxia]|uniref:uncharacterized protein LOC107170101 isoform X2 n=1 Tax=Diuraphis noxia TaxID=143948 RepID=UPI0007639260|nr:PREDICTED: uncharacterized protein LOC107170101 isoform X2 [Diuraphis noxia]
MDAIVEHVYAEPSVPPVIAITEVGHLNSSTFLDCGMAIEKTSNRPVLKIFNEHGGTVEEEDPSRKENGKKYLILRNKKTNKVSVYGANVTYLKKPDYFKMKTFEDQTLTDKSLEFNSVFGTKKSSRVSRSKVDNVVDVSTDVFENISCSSDVLQSSFSKMSEFLIYLPLGCNRLSSKLETVYPVSTLLLENEIDLMTDYAKEVISMLPISSENEDLSTFFITNLNRLSHKTVQNICLLSLADGLIELLRLKSADLNYRNIEIYPNCEVINFKVLDNFVEYSVTGRDLTSKMKDKAVCHIIIIMMLINMYTFDLSWISPFLPPSSQRRLPLLMKVVGATLLKDDPTKYTMKMPLASLPAFQKLSKKSRK